MSVNLDEESGNAYIVLRDDDSSFDYVSKKAIVEGDIHTVVHTQPEFPGGVQALYQHIGEKILYPEDAKKEGVQGKVFVQFVVNKEGEVMEVEAIRKVDPRLDKIAVAAVSTLPDFTPGKLDDGTVVNTRMVLPIVFQLPNDQKDLQSFEIEVQFNSKTWTGKITDQEGNPLAGVNIVEIDTENGTVSNLKGEFELPLISGNDIELSYTGYKKILVPSES
jgi:protein TonB